MDPYVGISVVAILLGALVVFRPAAKQKTGGGFPPPEPASGPLDDYRRYTADSADQEPVL